MSGRSSRSWTTSLLRIPDKVAQVQAKPTMLGWFVGQVMKTTGGKANPQTVNDLLKTKLGT